MIKIGINGFGRIGKCVFLQLLNNPTYNICCINALNISITEIEDYLKYDSVHKYNNQFVVEILSTTEFKINNHHIHLFSDRNAKNIPWKSFNCEYVIDATGSFLTSEKCNDHDVDYVIMSAPAKDNTKTIIYGVNHETYQGEKILSGSSCTTNCIAPMLKILNDSFQIKNCVFTTIHATTSSQYTVDVVNKLSRTNRSIFNNIIPHTTGASSSITCVLPELKGKIYGTSVRVPVSNCSLLDINIELDDKTISLNDIKQLLINSPYYKTIYDVNDKLLVSSDFITTATPTILDINASINMGNGCFKLMLWYDNEWSYSAQLIRLVESMFEYNNAIKTKYYMENIDMENKGIVCRFDFNVPTVNGEIIDDFRIKSAIPTIDCILLQNPKYIVLTSHFGRPTNKDPQFSLQFMIPTLEKYLNHNVIFLENGIDELTLIEINQYKYNDNNTSPTIFLLENLRFHPEEVNYEDNNITDIYKNLGDVFICDAFGCLHRKHMSIYAIKTFNKPYGYGKLIQKEIEMTNYLTNNKNKKVLGIIGGNKIKDKLPIINSLRLIPNSTIYIGGGLAKQYNESYNNVVKMKDGFGNKTLDFNMLHSIYIKDIRNTEYNTYDIGIESVNELYDLINKHDIIFWNGPLGVIEHETYKLGSKQVIEYLLEQPNKIIIIGGGETASLIKTDNASKNYSTNTNTITNTNTYISTGGGALLEYLQHKIVNKKNIVGLAIFE